MNQFDDQVLECQDCGDVIRRLEPQEVQMVADHPERFIMVCRRCARELGW